MSETKIYHSGKRVDSLHPKMNQDNAQLKLNAILGAKLIHKTTNYVYAMRTLEECGTLYDYLANIKTNKIVEYSINPIDKPIDDRKFILDITIKHQFNN